MNISARGCSIFFTIFIAAGCSSFYDNDYYHSKVDDIKPTPAIGEVPTRIELPQAWDVKTRMKFWFTSQGSRIIPYSWFTWLEQADNTELFRSSEHMESLRYLPMSSSSQNPGGLPIGFALDQDKEKGEAWVGMTCAACHTNQLDYNGNKFLIEGAPTLANFVEFFERLVEALNKTHEDDAKFERFAKNVLGNNYSENNANNLRAKLQEVAIATAERQAVNRLPEGYPSDFTSYARLDAFGNIQNAGTAFALDDLSNKNPPTAPVSYPFLWGTHQSDVVQWNASAPNTALIGPLVRNIGEVVGVFGNLKITEAPFWQRLIGKKHRYSSSVDMIGLGHLELWIKELRAPDWPEQYFPSINTTMAGEGAVLYAENCAQCHEVIPRNKQGDKYIASKVPLTVVGTDPAMATNANNHQARTLILEGSKTKVLLGDKFGETAPAIEIPVNGVIGMVLKDVGLALEAGLIPMDESKRKNAKTIKDALQEYKKEHDNISSGNGEPTLVYKARPLTSIWATAPYLHNGSVPNLWQMLQKPEDRVKSFWVGNREFDPKHVGFVNTSGLNEFKVLNENNEIQLGNSNLGHNFGTHLSDNEKWALIEYLKTL